MSICAFSGWLGTTGLMILSTVPCSFFRFLPMAAHRVRLVLAKYFIKELAWSDWNKRHLADCAARLLRDPGRRATRGTKMIFPLASTSRWGCPQLLQLSGY